MKKINRYELRKLLRRILYEYHIRGCEPGKWGSNRACDKHKETDIEKIIKFVGMNK